LESRKTATHDTFLPCHPEVVGATRNPPPSCVSSILAPHFLREWNCAKVRLSKPIF
ncbi:hypothetical protein SK128_025865, partial [Halocaridina rubra]